jgi:hypothetical protein
MFVHWRAIKEEIDFYQRQNKRLAVDDLLRRVFKKRTKHRKKIEENEQRIERLYWNAIDIH